jgi:hypothetical protein
VKRGRERALRMGAAKALGRHQIPSRPVRNMPEDAMEMGKGFVEGLIEALSDKHGQVDLRFQNLSVSVLDSRLAVRVSGSIQLSVHMRDLTEGEKDAHAQSHIAQLQT